MKPLWLAIGFLTVLPAPQVADAERVLGRSLLYFPLVGLLLGGLLGGAALGLGGILPPLPLAALLVALEALLTGGLHLDGLADAADGLLSRRPGEAALEIMRDSRIGAMGAMALVLALLLKVCALAAVPVGLLPACALLMPVVGRAAILVNLGLLPYARADGLGTGFFAVRSSWHIVLGLATALAFGFLAGGVRGLAAGAGACLLALGWAGLCRRRLGGATGDTLGAASELAELVPAFVFALRL